MHSVEVATPNWSDRLRAAVREMSQFELEPCPLKHYFAPGVYVREIFMRAGLYIIGKVHKTEHLNIISQGRVILVSEDGNTELTGPVTFVSRAGVQKALYIVEDTVWSTVHLTDERNLEALEAQLVEVGDFPVMDRTEERLAIAQAAKDEIRYLGSTTGEYA